MRVVVFGAGGQLGQELVRQLAERHIHVVSVTRKQLDITVADAVEALLERHKPDWVVNSAAYNQVDLAEREPQQAMAVNGFAVRNIAVAAEKIGAKLLHYSTDHVFDGRLGRPYAEDDPPAPPSAYGVSKLVGEHYARIYCRQAWVVRVAGVFGPAGRTTSRGNFPELILKKAAAGEPLKIVDDFWATPTYAVPLAARSIELLERAPAGLYHLGGGETVSWYEYALKIAAIAGIDADISPTNHREYVTPAGRPPQASLSNAKVEALGLEPMPSLDEALRDYMKRR